MLAQDRGWKFTKNIYTFTPSKLSFCSPENFLSDRDEQDLSIAILKIIIGNGGQSWFKVRLTLILIIYLVLKILNTNTKIAKVPQITGQTDKLTYYTTNQGIFTCALWSHTLGAITFRVLWLKKKRRGRPDRETDTQTHKIDWTPLGYSGPQCGDKNNTTKYISEYPKPWC